MLTDTVVTALFMHDGRDSGWDGAGWFFLLIPLFWILFFAILLAILFAIFGRRWRHGMRGPNASDGQPGWQSGSAARSGETTLAERFARGDIDEVEYRARLDVLRGNTPDAPAPPS